MFMSPKWLLGCFALWIIILYIIDSTQGAFVDSTEGVDYLFDIIQHGWDPKALFDVIRNSLTWNYPFFQSGIGRWLQIPLLLLSAATFIPLLIIFADLIVKGIDALIPG